MNTILFSFSGPVLDLFPLEIISVLENTGSSGTDDELVPR